MQLTVIHNPTSGDSPLPAAELRPMLEEAGYQVRYASTGDSWEKVLQEPADLVAVVGGDGTVRKVALAVAGTGVPFALLPLGTANNIAKSLGILGSTERIIRGWKRSRPRPFDVGVASAAWDDERFVESFGGGLFARLIARGEQEAEHSRSYVGRETDRALYLFREILDEAEPGQWELSLDGRDLSGSYLAVEALNTKFGGPNIPLAPDADTGDGLLDVVLIRRRDRRALLDYVGRRLELGAGSLPTFRVERGRSLRAIPPTSEALHLDDRAWPSAPPMITSARRTLRTGGRSARIVDVILRPGASRVVTGR